MSAEGKEKRRDGRIVLFSILSAFGVVFAVNGFFVYKAISTHQGEVIEDAYQKGLAYDEIVSEVRKLKAQQDGTRTP